MKRMHVWVSGRVQGVFFRANTQKQARSHDVAGWVKNLPDGRVEAVFEGDESAVDELVAWCEDGPPRARVDEVEAVTEEATGEFSSFEIRR